MLGRSPCVRPPSISSGGSQVSRLTAGIEAVALEVVARAGELNELDARAGDGDLGVTLSRGARAVLQVLPGLAGAGPAEVLRTCGATLAREAPSTSGTLVATALLRAARAAGEVGEAPDAASVRALLDAGRAGIAERGGAEPGSKTMLDGLVPAVAAASVEAERGASLEAGLAAAAAAADAGARATVDMVPRHGRAGWLAERSAGHEDAGARLVAIVLSAAAGFAAGRGAAT